MIVLCNSWVLGFRAMRGHLTCTLLTAHCDTLFEAFQVSTTRPFRHHPALGLTLLPELTMPTQKFIDFHPPIQGDRASVLDWD